MKIKKLFVLLLPALAVFGLIVFNACKDANKPANSDNAGLTLEPGFSAVAVAEKLGSARHFVITPENDIYVHLASPVHGKGILVLHIDGDKTTLKTSFADYGGTGIAIKNGYLYASNNTEVFRYKLNAQEEVIDPDHPERIVKGLLSRRMHEPKAICLDNDGNIYVNIGAYSNICSDYDPNKTGCPILDSAAGIWQFKVDKPDQTYGDGVHYGWGLRNVVGLAWNQQDNQLFVMQHGRDALHDLFPNLYTVHQSAELPAECMFAIKKGDNAGWPYVYYDWMR